MAKGKSKKIKFTSFEKKVLREVLKIPLGEVRTYKWLAEKVGSPSAARAVGNALRKNPFPLLIPCHRVILSNKNIGNYSQGKDIKKKLLLLEKEISQLIK